VRGFLGVMFFRHEWRRYGPVVMSGAVVFFYWEFLGWECFPTRLSGLRTGVEWWRRLDFWIGKFGDGVFALRVAGLRLRSECLK
jgi:hypothetical protein